MPIRHLDHVNLVTAMLNEMVAWPEAVPGLRSGPTPECPFGGAWLCLADEPMVHLVEDTGYKRTGSEAALRLAHFAFSATDVAAFEPFKKIEVSDAGLIQFHVFDPDGNHVHMDFGLNG